LHWVDYDSCVRASQSQHQRRGQSDGSLHWCGGLAIHQLRRCARQSDSRGVATTRLRHPQRQEGRGQESQDTVCPRAWLGRLPKRPYCRRMAGGIVDVTTISTSVERNVMITFGELFAGVGMGGLGMERAGWKGKWFVEIEDYPHQVYKRNFPESKGFYDVRDCGAHNLPYVDAIFGGFPCVDLSVAGRAEGIHAERSGLFFEFARIVGELRPRWWILENVTNLLAGDNGRWFAAVLSEMAALGYDATWHCIPATAVDAPHRRDRVWIVAHASDCTDSTNGRQEEETHRVQKKCRQTGHSGMLSRTSGNAEDVADTASFYAQGQSCRQEQRQSRGNCWRQSQSRLGRVADGLTAWLDEPADIPRVTQVKENRVNRLKALGNGLMWQIPYMIAQGINEIEKEQTNETGQ